MRFIAFADSHTCPLCDGIALYPFKVGNTAYDIFHSIACTVISDDFLREEGCSCRGGNTSYDILGFHVITGKPTVFGIVALYERNVILVPELAHRFPADGEGAGVSGYGKQWCTQLLTPGIEIIHEGVPRKKGFSSTVCIVFLTDASQSLPGIQIG